MELTKNRAGAIALVVALGRVAGGGAVPVVERWVSVVHGTHAVTPHDDGEGDDEGDDGGDGDDRAES
jgi:hypothetical protein